MGALPASLSCLSVAVLFVGELDLVGIVQFLVHIVVAPPHPELVLLQPPPHPLHRPLLLGQPVLLLLPAETTRSRSQAGATLGTASEPWALERRRPHRQDRAAEAAAQALT